MAQRFRLKTVDRAGLKLADCTGYVASLTSHLTTASAKGFGRVQTLPNLPLALVLLHENRQIEWAAETESVPVHARGIR